MQEKRDMSLRALYTGVWTAVGTAALISCFRPHWAPGFMGGAALSLFSLFSLRTCVRWLFRPGAPQSVRVMLSLVLWFKLPIYAVGLYMAGRLTGWTGGGVMALAAGAGLTPVVIFMKVLGDMMTQSANERAAIRARRLGAETAANGARSPQAATFSFGEGVG